jgi:hypothetical protein
MTHDVLQNSTAGASARADAYESSMTCECEAHFHDSGNILLMERYLAGTTEPRWGRTVRSAISAFGFELQALSDSKMPFDASKRQSYSEEP